MTSTRPRAAAASFAQGYPNPLRIGGPLPASATIEYAVAEAGAVTVTVYDVLGRIVKVLAHGELKPGIYTASWDATDEQGRIVPSGLYLVELRAENVRLVKNLSVVR